MLSHLGSALTAFVIPSSSSRHFSDLCMVCQCFRLHFVSSRTNSSRHFSDLCMVCQCFRLHFVSSRTNSVATQLAAAALK